MKNRRKYVVDIVDQFGRHVCCHQGYSFNKAIEFLETCDYENYEINFYRDVPDYHRFDIYKILEVLNYV